MVLRRHCLEPLLEMKWSVKHICLELAIHKTIRSLLLVEVKAAELAQGTHSGLIQWVGIGEIHMNLHQVYLIHKNPMPMTVKLEIRAEEEEALEPHVQRPN